MPEARAARGPSNGCFTVGGQCLLCRRKPIPLRTITGRRGTQMGAEPLGFDELAASFEPIRPAWYNRAMRKAFPIALALASLALAQSRPKVRAITAFIRIDAAHYDAQVGEAVKFLTAAREEYKAAGFEVETIRVVTQPLAEYTKGMKNADALALLRKYGELAAARGFSANLGAVQLTDDDAADGDQQLGVASRLGQLERETTGGRPCLQVDRRLSIRGLRAGRW